MIANIYRDQVQVLNFLDYYPTWEFSRQRSLGGMPRPSTFLPNPAVATPVEEAEQPPGQ